MNTEQKKRLREILKPLLEILLLGIGYYLLIRLTNLTIPCPIKLITGKYCPGCGISRMCLALLELDFKAAFLANRFLFIALPAILLFAMIKCFIYIKTGTKKQTKLETVFLLLLGLSTFAFWILRNTETFSYLAPIG